MYGGGGEKTIYIPEKQRMEETKKDLDEFKGQL